jgi:hypothetical protein
MVKESLLSSVNISFDGNTRWKVKKQKTKDKDKIKWRECNKSNKVPPQ